MADDEVGSASGVLSAVQSIASSVGVAVFGTLFFRMLARGRPDLGYHHVLLLQMGLVRRGPAGLTAVPPGDAG